MLAGADGSRNFGQQTRLSSEGAGRWRPGRKRKMGRNNLESMDGRVQAAQNTIGNKRGFIFRRMNIGMLDYRELVNLIRHASTGHGNSTSLLDGGRGYNSVSIPGRGFPLNLWKLVEKFREHSSKGAQITNFSSLH